MLYGIVMSAGVLAGFLLVWPQAIRIMRTGHVEGVSAATWTVSVIVFAGWTAWGFSTHFWAIVWVNVSALLAATLIMVFGTRRGWSGRWIASGAAASGVAVLLALIAPQVLATVVVLGGAAFRMPQIVSLARTTQVRGVSPVTWWLSFVTAALWTILGVWNGSVAVVVSSLFALSVTILLLGLLYYRRHAEFVTG